MTLWAENGSVFATRLIAGIEVGLPNGFFLGRRRSAVPVLCRTGFFFRGKDLQFDFGRRLASDHGRCAEIGGFGFQDRSLDGSRGRDRSSGRGGGCDGCF